MNYVLAGQKKNRTKTQKMLEITDETFTKDQHKNYRKNIYIF